MKKHLRKVFIAFGALVLAGVFCVVYGFYIEPYRLVVNRHEIKIKGWNREFDDLKIVAVSDIHGGSRGIDEEKLRRIVETISAEQADLVVFLGDFAAQSKGIGSPLKMNMRVMADKLSGIQSKYGVFIVMGNHDYWHGDREVKDNLTRVGYRVLENELAYIEKNGQKLRILGLKDHMKMTSRSKFAAEAKSVIEAGEQTGDIIVLEHSPDILPVITGQRRISPDLKLMLAGHTHGGQVWLPLIGSPVVPSSYGQKYAYGHIRDQDLDMFVTTGVGTSILPVRFLVPPEIAVLTIKAE
jgi:predicted MPP superfamily phosphohydrolase